MKLLQLAKKNINLYLEQKKTINLTNKEIEEIHNRGRITYIEKATEWEKSGICIPGEHIGLIQNRERCEIFSKNCHECLLDYASTQKSYEPFNNDSYFINTKEPKNTVLSNKLIKAKKRQ